MPAQDCKDSNEEVTNFMRPVPTMNDDEIGTPEDKLVADPLADETVNLFNDTARKNREIFTEIFRPVPSNFVTNWQSYQVRIKVELSSPTTDISTRTAGICPESQDRPCRSRRPA